MTNIESYKKKLSNSIDTDYENLGEICEENLENGTKDGVGIGAKV